MNLDYSLHYEYWHPDTAEHIAAMRRYFAAEIAPALPVERTGRALDIGCGFGYAMLALGDLGFARVEGLEASEQQAARARKYGLSVSVTADTISWLSGRPDTFAVVLLLDVLEHFPNEQQIPLLAAIHRSLIPGGRVIVKTPNANSIVASRWRYIDFTHHTSFTEHSLSFVLRNAGYDRIDIGSEKGVRRPILRFWRPKFFVADRRRFLIRWFWLQVFKAEFPQENLAPISFEANLQAVAHKAKQSEGGQDTAPAPALEERVAL